MAEPRLKKRHSKKAQEKESNGILEQSFGKRGQFTFFGDTYENIDGCLELYDEKLYPLNKKVFFQTKSTSVATNDNFYSYEIEHLNYYFGESHPTILFFVNIPKKETYYLIASKHYISKVLGINPQTHPEKTKRINFSKKDLFSGDIDKLVSEYENEFFELTHIRQLEATTETVTKNEVLEHKRKITQIVASEAEKIYALEGLLFFYFPVRMTDIDLMKKIADKMEISGKEMDYLLEKMFDSKILCNIRNLISITNPKIAKKFLDDFITKKGVEYLS